MKRERGRPRTGGKPYMTGKGYAFRGTFDVEGEQIKRVVHLDTFDLAVANIRRRKALAEPPPASAPLVRETTLSEYAEAWLERRDGNVASVKYERTLWTHVWKPRLGERELKSIRKPDVQTVLDDAAAGRIRPAPRKHRKAKGPPPRYSRQSLVHIRAVLVRVMGDAMRDELIDVNRAALSTVPDSAPRDGRPRAVLLDDEIAALLACPSVDVEIKMLVLVSRTVGGLRAGDLNALDWQAFGPGFATLTFIRSKTKKKRPMPETHEVPADARTWLEAWHTAHGSPEAGAVFPVRRGPRAGATKAEASHGYARKLRKALLKAGITRPELHRKDLPTTRRVDFHSTRRAYATAVGDHAQALEAAALIGHASPVMTMGYQDRTRVRVLPGAAVPVLPPAPTNLATRRVQNQKAK